MTQTTHTCCCADKRVNHCRSLIVVCSHTVSAWWLELVTMSLLSDCNEVQVFKCNIDENSRVFSALQESFGRKDFLGPTPKMFRFC